MSTGADGPMSGTTVRGCVPRSVARLDAASVRMRGQLGLPADRPVIMAGHQAEWWHPGIVAKIFAARALAEHAGGVVAWVVVDQDDNDPGLIRVPVVRDGGTVAPAEIRFAGESHAATGWRGPLAVGVAPPVAIASASAERGVARMVEAMQRHAGESSVARQVTRGAFEVLGESAPVECVVYASQIARTDAWAALVHRMREDPRACAAAYNVAVRDAGVAGLVPMGEDAARGRWELPVWSIDGSGARLRVWSDGVAAKDASEVHPRALAMTAVLRMHACDAFVHGVGGYAYDAAMEAWLGAWAGAGVAPMALATADVFLPMGGGASSEAEAARASAWAHRARHDPRVLGEDALGARKMALVERIAADRAAGRDAGAGYAEMQSVLAAYRESHARELREAEARAEAAQRSYRASRAAVRARDWPFPLYEDAALRGMGEAVAAAVRKDLEQISAPRSMSA